MIKTKFNVLCKRVEKNGDRIFIVTMLAFVMVVAFAFKKPNTQVKEVKNHSIILLK